MKPLFSDSEPYPPVYQAATLCKNYKGCRDLHIRILPHPKFQMTNIREQVGVNEIKRHKKDGIVIKRSHPQSYIIKNSLSSYFSAIFGIGFL